MPRSISSPARLCPAYGAWLGLPFAPFFRALFLLWIHRPFPLKGQPPSAAPTESWGAFFLYSDQRPPWQPQKNRPSEPRKSAPGRCFFIDSRTISTILWRLLNYRYIREYLQADSLTSGKWYRWPSMILAHHGAAVSYTIRPTIHHGVTVLSCNRHPLGLP